MATVLQCDHCQSFKDVKTVRVFRRRVTTAAGDCDDVNLTVDLCQNCRDSIFFTLIFRGSDQKILDLVAGIIKSMGVGKEIT